MTLPLSSSRSFALFPAARSAAPLRTLDVLVDGFNVTARVGAGQTLPFLRDLAIATADLATGQRSRATVHFYQHDDTWELGVERDGTDVLLSVYRNGGVADVAVHERRVAGTALLEGVSRALGTIFERTGTGTPNHAELTYARHVLGTVDHWSTTTMPLDAVRVLAEGDLAAPLAFSCEFPLRGAEGRLRSTVARADLFSLLVRGRFHVWAQGAARSVGDTFVVLLAERLLTMAEDVLGCAEKSVAFHRREDVAGTRLGVRLEANGRLALLLGPLQTTRHEVGDVSPGLDARSFALAVAAFGRSLCRALLRHDRSQAQNLRFSAFRLALRRLTTQLQPDPDDVQPQINAYPERYRAYALDQRSSGPPDTTPTAALGRSKLRYEPRWVAAVPGIDLATTFLCGQHLLVGGRRETACLDRSTGTILWQRSTRRAVCFPTPCGLARLHADGVLQVHDFGTGDVLLDTTLAPVRTTPPTGMVIDAAGLPKLLIVAEGDRHVSAVDLVSGDVRWRQSVRRSDTCRLRRAGRLLLEVSGETTLTALDVSTGDVVWRICDSRPFRSAPVLDHDTLATYAGEGHDAVGAKLYVLDAWSGTVRFAVDLPATLRVVGAPLVTEDVIAVVTQDDRGLGVLSFDRTTGQPRYAIEPGLVSAGASWMVVDNMLLANSDEGNLVALDAATGHLAYRLVLSRGTDDTCPRRLEPVLRCGALFVPQRQVHVVRPRDGSELGILPTELVPDLLRVDELCNVYVAEESGHVAAFGAGPPPNAGEVTESLEQRAFILNARCSKGGKPTRRRGLREPYLAARPPNAIGRASHRDGRVRDR